MKIRPHAEPPLFVVECPTCRAAVAVKRTRAGSAAACPACSAGFLVPEPQLPGADFRGPAAGTMNAPPPPVAMESQDRDGAPDGFAAPTAADLVETSPPVTDPALRFREPVLLAGTGDDAVAVRRLSPEERRLRRTRRNVVILLVGGAILAALTFALGGR